MRLLIRTSSFIVSIVALLACLALLLIAGFFEISDTALPDLEVAENSVGRALLFAGIAFGIFFAGLVLNAIARPKKSSN